MDQKVILIGPISAGKSTLSRLVAEQLDLPCRHMDGIRLGYYREIGYDEELAKEAHAAEGFWGLYKYWKPFEAYAVERLLTEPGSVVVDLGGGHSVYESESLLSRVERLMDPFPYVFLLLPSPDPDASIRALKERAGEIVSGGVDFHEHFVRHPSNYRLAKHIVYTEGRTPEECCAEIVGVVRPAVAP
jgi:shikimate kinase